MWCAFWAGPETTRVALSRKQPDIQENMIPVSDSQPTERKLTKMSDIGIPNTQIDSVLNTTFEGNHQHM